MAIGSKWSNVFDALDRLSVHEVLIPTLTAMRALAEKLEADPELADLSPTLSHASLFLSRDDDHARVYVGWQDGEFEVAHVHPPMNILAGTRVGLDQVADIVRERFAEHKKAES